MSGTNSGVVVRIKSVMTSAVQIYCYAHGINLSLKKSIIKNQRIKDFFETSQKLGNFCLNQLY